MESPVRRKFHAGFGKKGACFLSEEIRAWQRVPYFSSINRIIKHESFFCSISSNTWYQVAIKWSNNLAQTMCAYWLLNRAFIDLFVIVCSL